MLCSPFFCECVYLSMCVSVGQSVCVCAGGGWGVFCCFFILFFFPVFFNIGNESIAPVAPGRPSGERGFRRDPGARHSGREECVLLTIISTGLLIH